MGWLCMWVLARWRRWIIGIVLYVLFFLIVPFISVSEHVSCILSLFVVYDRTELTYVGQRKALCEELDDGDE